MINSQNSVSALLVKLLVVASHPLTIKRISQSFRSQIVDKNVNYVESQSKDDKFTVSCSGLSRRMFLHELGDIRLSTMTDWTDWTLWPVSWRCYDALIGPRVHQRNHCNPSAPLSPFHIVEIKP